MQNEKKLSESIKKPLKKECLSYYNLSIRTFIFTKHRMSKHFISRATNKPETPKTYSYCMILKTKKPKT